MRHLLALLLAIAVPAMPAGAQATADAPTLTANDVSGDEDSAIALDITSALTDSSETLSITVSGVPTGATLSAGTDNGDGSWTLTPAQLSGLTLTPPSDSDADFTLTVTATSTDGSDTAQTVDTFDVTVNAVAPGLVATPWTEDWDDLHAGIGLMSPIGRSATPEDCAQAIMLCVTNGYMSGSIVKVDGATTLVL